MFFKSLVIDMGFEPVATGFRDPRSSPAGLIDQI